METKPLLFFDWLLRASWQAAILVALILILQWLVGPKLAARWRYILWLVVFVRLIIPISPPAPISLFNIAKFELQRVEPRQAVPPVVEAPPVFDGIASAPHSAAPASGRSRWLTELNASESEFRFDVAGASHSVRTSNTSYWICFACWAAGFLFLLGRWIWQNGCILWRLCGSERISEPAIVELVEECRERSGVRRKVELISVTGESAPALYGVFRLRLLLPRQLTATLDREQLKHILLHEFAHVKRCDSVMHPFILVIPMLHWFNPLVWLAFRRMALERELACDELALGWLKRGENRAYGGTILRLLESAPLQAPAFSRIGILEDYRQLLSRMHGIALYGKRPARPLLAVSLLMLLCAAGLSNPQITSNPVIGAKTAETLTRSIFLPPGNEAGGWLSPDESKITYTDWTNRLCGNLFVKDLIKGTIVKLTEGVTNVVNLYEFADVMVWSPDSTKITYDWYTERGTNGVCDLYIATADGKEKKLLHSGGPGKDYIPRDWSRDGKILLCDRLARNSPQEPVLVKELVAIDAESGEVKMILKDIDSPNRGRSVHPRFSPDGSYVVFHKEVDGQRDLYVIRVSDGTVTRLIDSPVEEANPVWSADGKTILFCSDRRGQWDLWALPFNNGKAASHPFLVKAGFGDYPLNVTVRGKLLYYVKSMPLARSEHLITVNSNIGDVSAPKMICPHVDTPGAQWLPENRICYWNKTTLHVVSQDGKEEIHPTALKAVNRFRVSDNGKWISVLGTDAMDQKGLFVMNVDSKEVQPLLISDTVRLYGFTLDSTELVVDLAGNPSAPNLAAIHCQTKNVRKLKSPQKWPEGASSILESTRKMVFVESDPEKREERVVMYDFESGEAKLLFRVAHPQKVLKPQWRWPRSGGLYEVIYRHVGANNRHELRIFNLEHSTHRTIPTGDWDVEQFQFPNIAWDGSVAAVAIGKGTLATELLLFAMDGKWERKLTFNDALWSSGVWFGDSKTLHISLRNQIRQEIGIMENYLASAGL